MSNKIPRPFPSQDPAGITPGHDELAARPPDPRTDDEASKTHRPKTSEPDGDDKLEKNTPARDLVSIGTSPTNQPA